MFFHLRRPGLADWRPDRSSPRRKISVQFRGNHWRTFRRTYTGRSSGPIGLVPRKRPMTSSVLIATDSKSLMHDVKSTNNIRPPFDPLLQQIADYVYNSQIQSTEAYESA